MKKKVVKFYLDLNYVPSVRQTASNLCIQMSHFIIFQPTNYSRFYFYFSILKEMERIDSSVCLYFIFHSILLILFIDMKSFTLGSIHTRQDLNWLKFCTDDMLLLLLVALILKSIIILTNYHFWSYHFPDLNCLKLQLNNVRFHMKIYSFYTFQTITWMSHDRKMRKKNKFKWL
jgi:hypothetical protein